MKRLICLLLVALLILSGCGNAPHEASSTTGAGQSQETATDTTGDTTTAQGDTTNTTTTNTETTDSTEQTPTENTTSNPTTTEKPTQPDKDTQTTPQTPTQSTTANCSHSRTSVQGATSATCTTAGHTGDTVCNDCKITVSRGSSVPATGHTKTELRNQKDATTSAEGYTGDTVCVTCGATVSKGDSIPKLPSNQVTYTLPNGTSYTVDKDVNITDYTMKLNTKSASHTYYDAERAILSYFNKVRGENGLSQLRWNEDAYCFVKIRAQEQVQSKGHTRPNGEGYSTVYENVYFKDNEHPEEICNKIGNCDDDFLKNDADGFGSVVVEASWMNSSGHRAQILNSRVKSVSISVYLTSEGNCHAVAHFFYY